MITQAGPKKLQINSRFNQQLKCILRVCWADYVNITHENKINIKGGNLLFRSAISLGIN